MTTKDTTRFLEQPRKHYAAAYLQQGRPLLDSDFNEGARLLAEDRRRAFVDVTGGMGSPDLGFYLGAPIDPVSPDTSSPEPLRFPFTMNTVGVRLNDSIFFGILPVGILPGSVHLGGMRFELEKPEHIAFQRDFLQMKQNDLQNTGPNTLYYLNAWEQIITAAEDPELAEQALGGPDTAVRVRRMRRVEVRPLIGEPQTCLEAFEQQVAALEADNAVFDWYTGELRSKGLLQLQFRGGNDGDLCTPDPPTQYLGTENQTLRIMLTSPDTFVWTIDNGAPLYRVTAVGIASSNLAQVKIKMLTPPRDVEHQPRPNQVVEFLPFAALLDRDAAPSTAPHAGKIAAEIGEFMRVGKFDASDNSFTVTGPLDTAIRIRDMVHRWDDHPAKALLPSNGNERYLFVRFWHDAPTEADVTLKINRNVNGPPVAPQLGKTGILPVFHRAGRRGDYWTATLRVDQRDRIVPYDLLTTAEGVPPHGPRHFYMPISVVRWPLGEVTDCRPRLRRLRDMACETRTVGDGLKSIGDYKTIQAAIDALPPSGGRVVVRPGLYREEIVLRSDVTLDGCGEDTIIESPNATGAGGLISILNDVARVRVRNFRLHAIAQAAVRATSSEDVELSSLNVLAYRIGTGGPEPGAGDTDTTAIFEFDDVSGFAMRSLRITASNRAGIRASGSEDIRIEGVSIVGDPAMTVAPWGALLQFSLGTERVTVRDASLEAYGQNAVYFDGFQNGVRNISLSKLEILSGAHSTGLQTQASIDIGSGVVENIVIEDSRIVQEGSATEYAAIMIQGKDITIRNNRIESLPQCFDDPLPENPAECVQTLAVAWGGIHVRGLSERVDIRGNRISGGLGHGITLGSVLWNNGSLNFRFGAGKAQAKYDLEADPPTAYVDGDLAGFTEGEDDFTALDEGLVTDVRISDNQIEGMGTNGISSLTVLGLVTDTEDTDFLEIRRLFIDRNRIAGNLRQLPATVDARDDVIPLSSVPPESGGTNHPLDVPRLPYAGIALATLTQGATISNNQIVNNGTSETIAICGVFVLNADGVTITKNRIIGNGGLASTTLALQPGVRAGIAVLLAGTETASTSAALDDILAVESTSTAEANTLRNEVGDFALRVIDNVVLQPEGRALYAVSTGMVSVDGNHLGSRGYHGTTAAVDQSGVGDVVFVQGLGGAWETVDVESFPSTNTHANGMTESSNVNFASLLAPNVSHGWLNNAIPSSPRLYVGSGGAVMFHNNQVIYDWEVKQLPAAGTPLSYFPVAVLAQDHASAIGNQVATRIQGTDLGTVAPPVGGVEGLFLAQALVGGLTAQVARNRLAAPVESARISLITAAEILNITALNHGTHPTLAYRWRHPVSFRPPGDTSTPTDTPRSFHLASNPALFIDTDRTVMDLHNFDPLKTTIRAFFRLMNQRTSA